MFAQPVDNGENNLDWDEDLDVVGSLPLPSSSRRSPYGPVATPSATSPTLLVPNDEHEIIEVFMTVGEGVSVAEQFRNEAPEPSGSSTMLSRISSRLSASTAATFLPSQGGYGGSLHSLTRLINEHTALYYATIVSTECYAEAIIPGVVSHRFLLLELARPDKKTICVRLDRRRSRVTSTIRFVRLGGSTEAHDIIQLSSSKDALFIKRARCENRQEFTSPPTLSHLNRLLAVIIENLSTYELWPSNCWFFVSLLQKHLSVVGAGGFTFGGPIAENLDLATRSSLDKEVERRTKDTEQRLRTVLTSASDPQRDLSLIGKFPRWDIALYVRHVLRDVPLQDHSLVDRLIDSVKDSFLHAVVACHYVRHSPAQTPHYCLRSLVDHGTNALLYPILIFSHTLATLDDEILSQLKGDPLFHEIATNIVGWDQLCKLHHCIARICVHTMERLLSYNICLIASSYVQTNGTDTQHLVELAKREGRITSALIYACSHWTYHTSFAVLEEGSEIAELVLKFLNSHALQWLEILSLIGKNVLQTLSPLSKSKIPHDELRDTIRFLTTFVEMFSEPIARSVPHIYIGALLFSPLESLTRKTLSPAAKPRLISYRIPGQDTFRVPSEPLINNEVDPELRGMVFSSNNSQIIYICDDGVLRMWDFCNGNTTAITLEGFERGRSTRIPLSADGTLFVTDSRDHSLHLWDSQSGTKIGPPLIGHKDTIYSVALSPDGKLIASGSLEGEIRLWDAHGPKAIIRPRMGRARRVRSLAFSPDGKHLASGGDDRLVYIWDMTTGLQIGEASKGHSRLVRSVTYSPDGRQIASGSWDGTVRVWDAATGGLCFGALKQDGEEWILSVTYSPDGTILASGGDMGNINIWDSRSGNHLNHLEVGQDSIWQIFFSPNGKRFACCSQYKIHIWELDEEWFILKDSTGILALKESEQSFVSATHHKFQKLPLPRELKVNDNGWLRGTGGELIVWVPPGLRTNIQALARLVIDVREPFPTVIDFGDFAGERWAEMFSLVPAESKW